jgi:superfamily II DNA or RNA helicase
VQVANANYKKPLNDFKEKKTQLLIATDKLVSEGIDIPSVDTLFLVTQHGSNVITFQAIGRILRKGSEKKPMVIDIEVKGFDQYERSANKRLAIYQEIADNVITKEIL